MKKFGKSQSVKRVDDLRFLTGHGGPVLHDVVSGNVAFDWDLGNVDAALSTDAQVSAVRSRAIVNSLEPRDRFDEPEGHRLHDRANGRGVRGAGKIFQ